VTGRSEAAAGYRKLYKTAAWQKLRAHKLTLDPLCERCLLSEVVTEAAVVHHREGGHKGDEAKFFDLEGLESLCKPHHDSDGRLEDIGRTKVRYGADGWPL
jgi:hypothetical protein